MPAAATPNLKPGRVYRTRDFARWSANPTRLAKRLVRQGALEQLAHGLFARPRQSSFGPVPPNDEALMRAFLGTSRFLFTGPEFWNLLRLGATAWFPARLVYNEKRSGKFLLAGRPFLLRRVRFPRNPSPEWYVVDLFENAGSVSLAQSDLGVALTSAMREHRFQAEPLQKYAREFGTGETQKLIAQAIQDAEVTRAVRA